jgi:hypothetical protein
MILFEVVPRTRSSITTLLKTILIKGINPPHTPKISNNG